MTHLSLSISKLIAYLPDKLCQFTIHDSTMHNSCINYATMLNLYRDNSCHRKEKYKCDMQRPSLPGEENKRDQKATFFENYFLF